MFKVLEILLLAVAWQSKSLIDCGYKQHSSKQHLDSFDKNMKEYGFL